MTRVLVCGGRHYDDHNRIFNVLNNYDADHDFTAVIHGAATGADRAAGHWAMGQQHIEEIRFPANWHKYGKAAGPIRNQRMLSEGKPDLVIAFPGGHGTQHMVEIARLQGIEVVEVRP